MAISEEKGPVDPVDRWHWFGVLAFALTLIYPAFWFSQFCYGALPALVRIAAGDELKAVRISVLSVFLFSAPADPRSASAASVPLFGRDSLLGIAIVVVVAAGLLRRRHGIGSGLFVAVLGYTGFERLLRRLWTQSADIGWILAAVVFFALWTLGLRRLILATTFPAVGFGWRFTAAVVCFTLPLGMLWLTLHWTLGMPLMRRLVWLFVPGLLPSGCAAVRSAPAGVVAVARLTSWRGAAGMAVTAALATTLTWAGPPAERSFSRAQAERAQTMVDSLPQVSPNAPYPREFFQRGVNFTAEFPAPYDSIDALQSLEHLPEYGVNAVALVAYGWTTPGRPTVRISSGLHSWESDQGIENLARLAHSRGMKVLLKPQVWVPGGSPIDLGFHDPAEREEWFEQYGQFIEHYAVLATRIHADLFTVGVELAGLSRYDRDWRRLIARVRQTYPGPLVYAANFGPDFQNITFWDALDYVGLDEYYPLPPSLSAEELVRQVERVTVEFRRPVIFTEVGFTSLAHPERRPWDESPRPISLEDQARCYEAIFQAFYGKPWFKGMYWWKVGSNEAGGPDDGSFTPWGKPAMDVVRDWYLGGGR